MKSKIINAVEPKPTFSLPMTMKSKTDTLVILFITASTGVVLHSDKTGYQPVGKWDNTWINCYSDYWEIFEGIIEFKQ